MKVWEGPCGVENQKEGVADGAGERLTRKPMEEVGTNSPTSSWSGCKSE